MLFKVQQLGVLSGLQDLTTHTSLLSTDQLPLFVQSLPDRCLLALSTFASPTAARSCSSMGRASLTRAGAGAVALTERESVMAIVCPSWRGDHSATWRSSSGGG